MSLCCPLQAEEMSDQRENQDKLGTELMQPHGMWTLPWFANALSVAISCLRILDWLVPQIFGRHNAPKQHFSLFSQGIIQREAKVLSSRRLWPLQIGFCPKFAIEECRHSGVSKNNGIPKSSILIGFFHYKPSILGYPYFWKHPYDSLVLLTVRWCQRQLLRVLRRTVRLPKARD